MFILSPSSCLHSYRNNNVLLQSIHHSLIVEYCEGKTLEGCLFWETHLVAKRNAFVDFPFCCSDIIPNDWCFRMIDKAHPWSRPLWSPSCSILSKVYDVWHELERLSPEDFITQACWPPKGHVMQMCTSVGVRLTVWAAAEGYRQPDGPRANWS